MRADRVIVVGAGIGGLTAALGLAVRGCDVTVVERAQTAGGKVREIEVGGRRIDSGPTVMTMKWIFEEIFNDAGTNLDEHVKLEPLETLARHYWSGGASLDLFADLQRTADAVGRFAGAAEAQGYLSFCARAEQIFDTLEQPFMHHEPPGILALMRGIGLRKLAGMGSISPFTTLWRELGRYFRDPRLQQLFGRYATYCGSSPFLAPATLMLIAHVERKGVWSVAGGMRAIPEALVKLAVKRGVSFRFGAHVTGVTLAQGAARGVRLADGETLAADAVVINGDVAALSSGLFGAAVQNAVTPTTVRQRSMSALTWSMVAETSGVTLDRHSVFFSDDYAAEFGALQAGRLARAPTVYVCAQDRDARGALGSSAPERLFLIVNAPATRDPNRNPIQTDCQEIEQCTTATFRTLEACGLKLARQPEMERMTAPADFAQLFPATGGALYGMASHGWQASFRRSGSQSRIPRLYLAGGSVHPGPGIPMAALSGRMAVSRIASDLASMRRSHRVAMPGGISMR